MVHIEIRKLDNGHQIMESITGQSREMEHFSKCGRRSYWRILNREMTWCDLYFQAMSLATVAEWVVGGKTRGRNTSQKSVAVIPLGNDDGLGRVVAAFLTSPSGSTQQ